MFSSSGRLDPVELNGGVLVHGNLKLPSLQAQFRIPRLAHRPQDPIMDYLPSLSVEKQPTLPVELVALTEALTPKDVTPSELDDGELWAKTLEHTGATLSQLRTWDALRPTMPKQASSSAFLSEQADAVFTAARYLYNPPVRKPGTEVQHVTQAELMASLGMTILGTSSELHTWDPASETFVTKGSKEVLVDGRDDVISDSIMSRFLTIGTLMRRLETLVSTFRSRYAREGPTVHALTHSLASSLVYLRDCLSRALPSNFPRRNSNQTVTSVWSHLSQFEDVLIALAAFCERDLAKSPSQYSWLDPSSVTLLSRIWEHLSMHIERRSPPYITGIFAYLLTGSSNDYIQHVCFAVGFGSGSASTPTSNVGIERQLSGLDNEEDELEEAAFDPQPEDETYPSFFSPELAENLSRAKKSIELLRSAQPDHPLLKEHGGHAISWLWTEPAVIAAWSHAQTLASSAEDALSRSARSPNIQSEKVDEQDLKKQFGVFDLEPGLHLESSVFADSYIPATASNLRRFLETFPDDLPPLTPTLSQLAELVFMPLTEHVATLSAALLDIFLSPESPLNLHAHLSLLKEFLLLTSPSFKFKLSSALFSDTADLDFESSGSETHRSRRPRKSNAHNGITNSRPWALGLASELTDRNSWPPGGADLSFVLKTVIVDSIERNDEISRTPSKSGRVRVLEEAEFRLGFAIRDLPVGAGRNKWLDPLCIEALDFLYMDYKTPLPLTVLITPEIMSKYQRVFAFLLRVMRVTSVVRTIYRITRKGAESLFPTLTSCSAQLLHFRFIASSFVHAFSGYLFDTAIGANFDAFLSRLLPHASQHAHGNERFADIYSLAEHHSKVLDDILVACVLKSGQRAVGDLLRGALEIILDFGILVGQLHLGQVKEHQGAPRLEALYHDFRGKTQTLESVKVLRGLVDKTSASVQQTEHSSKTAAETRVPPGGSGSLHHLVLRLDVADWWISPYKGKGTKKET